MNSKPTLKQRQRANRNEAILDAAETLLNEKGFSAVRLEDIASEACISRPTLYSHFRSKDDVAQGLALRYLRQVSEFLTGQDAARTATGRLREFIEWAVEFRFGGNSRFVHALAQYVLPLRNVGSAIEAAEDEVLTRLASLIEAAQKEKGVRDDIAAACLAGIMLGSQHGYLDHLLASDTLTVAEIAHAWYALLAPPSSSDPHSETAIVGRGSRTSETPDQR